MMNTMRKNRYLENKAMRRDMRRSDRMTRDGRNPYGSKGGYVRDYNHEYRGNDYAMDYRNDYPEHYSRRNDYNYSNDYRANYNDYAYKQYREYDRPMEHKDYMMRSDYRMMPLDYASEKEHYEKKLHEWIEKLKRKDRFGVSKEQILRQAKNMQVRFEEYDENEFYATYLMLVSDFPKIANDYNQYLSMAKSWLEDDDVMLKGGDKLCAYLYTIVLAEEDD